jgi:hypothetical protein
MLKKCSTSIAWGILSVWVFYTIIHTVLAVFQLGTHHSTVDYALKHKKEKHLKHLTIPVTDKAFVRINKKEFVWQGEWYDIVNLSEKEGAYHIIAYPDKKEAKLRKNLADSVEQNQEKSGQHTFSLKFEWKEIYISQIKYVFYVYFISVFGCKDSVLNTLNTFLTLPTPPPER